MFVRKVGLTVGMVVRTSQHYVKTYKEEDKKRLPDSKKATQSQYYYKSAATVLWQARNKLLPAFPDIKSATLSSPPKHLIQHASLTLK
jgi:hypothetical protein